MSLDHRFAEPTAIRTNLGAIFVSLELSRSTWLITSLSPGGGEKMSKHGLSAGNIAALLARLTELKQKAFAGTGQSFQVIVIQEAGLDGFWIHRVLQSEGIESHVVDAATIATSRRRRRAKTDRIDGEALVRALLAYKRGEPRVCAMVRTPTPEEEDRRRLCRERKTLTNKRVQHVNRIKGLMFCQGISDYEPLRRNRRQRLDELKTGGGRPLPPHLKDTYPVVFEEHEHVQGPAARQQHARSRDSRHCRRCSVGACHPRPAARARLWLALDGPARRHHRGLRHRQLVLWPDPGHRNHLARHEPRPEHGEQTETSRLG